jgi:class 3 adenylate cyclase/pimeloyl-ACP methyl ester carboxylesterase
VRYARTSDGIDIAYGAFGDGPRDLVLIQGFTTHLDFLGDSPWHSYWMRRLGERFRVIQFDKRGSGLSDRSTGLGSVEDRTRDVVAVMDAVGSERACIAGVSEGGPIGLTFAATYPERVDKLVLYGTFARMLWAPDYTFGVTPEVADWFIEAVENTWGTGECFGAVFVSNAAEPEVAKRVSAKFERNACTPQMAGEILRRNTEIDVRALLPGIGAPTLVLHTTGDPLIPVAMAGYLADHIRDAEYFEAPGEYHCTWTVKDFAPFMDRIIRFLCDETVTPSPVATPIDKTSRSVATVLYTDIVGSTDSAAALGDGPWREVLQAHDRLCAETTKRLGGRVVKSTGDGMLALFDGPSRAVNAMEELGPALEQLSLRLRAGIHTGEIERNGDDVAGIGVHIAARIMALAEPGQVLASRTVRDLAAGSGIVFTDIGSRVLRGVPGDWELYGVSLATT